MIESILNMYAANMTTKHLNKLKRLLGSSMSVSNMFSKNIYSRMARNTSMPGVNLVNDLFVATSNLQSAKFEGLADKFNRTPSMSYGFKSSAEEAKFNNEAFEVMRQLRRTVTAKIVRNLMVLTPVDTGRLLSSLTIDEDEMTTTLSFNTPYMVYVHELNNKHEAPSRNKFLEIAVDNAVGKLKDTAEMFTYNLIIDDAPTLKLIINTMGKKEGSYKPIPQDDSLDEKFYNMQGRVIEDQAANERETLRMNVWAKRANQLKLL